MLQITFTILFEIWFTQNINMKGDITVKCYVNEKGI